MFDKIGKVLRFKINIFTFEENGTLKVYQFPFLRN